MSNNGMDKTYSPKDIENKWYLQWENAGYFKPSGDTTAPSYSIAISPPNVTGSLRMGHAFQDTIMDCLIHYHRMLGHNTLWQRVPTTWALPRRWWSSVKFPLKKAKPSTITVVMLLLP